MLYGLGAFAVLATVVISFNNPRAIFWVTLGSAKVLFCSLYVHMSYLNVNLWFPDDVFVSLIATAIFCHLLDKYRIFRWELVLYRLVLLSMIVSAGKFFGVPILSQLHTPLNILLYSASFALIFVNSLLKAGLLTGDNIKRLNRFLKTIGCNSKELEKTGGWAQRWL